jgi:hypothetical protein
MKPKYLSRASFLAMACWLSLAPGAYPQSAEPLKTVVPINLDVTTGNITVGGTVHLENVISQRNQPVSSKDVRRYADVTNVTEGPADRIRVSGPYGVEFVREFGGI